jgi:hypothetical protein
MEQQDKYYYFFDKIIPDHWIKFLFVIIVLDIISMILTLASGQIARFKTKLIFFILFFLPMVYCFGPGLRKTSLIYVEIKDDGIIINKSRFRIKNIQIKNDEIAEIKIPKYDKEIKIILKNKKKITILTPYLREEECEELKQLFISLNMKLKPIKEV